MTLSQAFRRVTSGRAVLLATRFRRVGVASIALAAFAVASTGCEQAPERSRPTCTDGGAGVPVDPRLLGFLSRARSAHHIADAHVDERRLAEAVRVLRAVVATPLTRSGAMLDEEREVLADTRARLADLESQLGQAEAARADVAEGLKLVPEPSYFRGYLFEVSGLVDERDASALEKSGQSEKAKVVRERALRAFETAMTIQAAVIERAVTDGGNEPADAPHE